MDDNIIDTYYMKFDRYIAEIEIYCDSNKYNNKSCIPVCYRILNFIDIVNQTESEHIYLDEHMHTCLIENEQNDFTITPHAKILSKNMVIFYKDLCEFSNKIIKNIILDSNNRIEIFIIDKLQRAYKNKEMAFYENFMENKHYLYYSKGYIGIYRKYNFYYNNDGFIEQEYYINNGKIEGIAKTYDHHKNLIKEENYINGYLYGQSIYYEYDENDKKINQINLNYITSNYYSYTKYDIDMNLIEFGYYYIEINITWFVKIKEFIFNFLIG
jgi:antitoxin component YwqK of YwqJK toxin-antitoxin module